MEGGAMGREPLGEVRTLVLRVRDMDAACRFYEQALGLEVKLRDGARWAQFDAGGIRIALAAEGELPSGEPLAVNLRVADVAEAVRRLGATGVATEGPVRGAHEVRASFRDPDGNLFYVYAPLQRS